MQTETQTEVSTERLYWLYMYGAYDAEHKFWDDVLGTRSLRAKLRMFYGDVVDYLGQLDLAGLNAATENKNTDAADFWLGVGSKRRLEAQHAVRSKKLNERFSECLKKIQNL